MKLYHGSKNKVDALEKRQAGSPKAQVPDGELLEAIYFTPDYGFAVACGARPEGTTEINGEEKTIKFENPELFNPEQEIYVYCVDSENIMPDYLKKIDGHQYAIVGLSELKPESVDVIKASEVMKYYRLLNWESKEKISEKLNEPRFNIK